MTELDLTVVDEGLDELYERGLLERQPRPPRQVPRVCEREVGEVALAQGGTCR